MNTNSDIHKNRLEEGIIDANYKSLLQTLGNIAFFELSDAELNVRDNCATASIHMDGQQIIDDVSATLANILNVNILYDVVSDKGRLNKTVLYSMPYADEMFVICFESVQYGIVDNTEITFFDSLETMYDSLKDELDYIQTDVEQNMADITVIRLQSATELHACFL